MRAGARTLELAAGVALFVCGCARSGGRGPAEIAYDRDVCTACSMVISEQQFAAQVQGPHGEPRKFDDLGCALHWLDVEPFKDDPGTRLWVTAPGGGWVDARAARYTSGHTTPMGYGFATSDQPTALDLDEVRARLHAAAGPRQAKGAP